MSKPIPLSGGRKILPSREDLERQPFSFFASGKKRTSAAASAKYDLSGLILDDEGDPISGVTVTLSGDADSSVVTGVDGAFLFEDLSKGDYTVTPSRASFVFTPASRSVTQLAEDTALDSFEGVGSIYIISGTITGDEVENVTVTLSGDASDSAVTGADGTYSFEGLADGSYTVTPSLAGYGFTPAATNVTINNADQTGKDFVSALLVYDISGAITGDEVEGVTVALTGDSSDSVVTGVGGTFTFADLPPGGYTLTPTLAGYTFAPASINVTIVAANQTDQDFVSTLVTWTVSGTVEQATYDISGTITGDEVEGVTVTLTGDASDSTTTAADGTYSFTGLDSGSYTVTPTLAGYEFTPASASVTVSGADDTGNDFASTLLQQLNVFIGFEDVVVPAAPGGGWNGDPLSNGTVATMAIAADTAAYTPGNFTKAARANIASASWGMEYQLKRLPASGKIRVACLYRVGTGTLDGVRSGIGESASVPLESLHGYAEINQNPDTCRVAAYNSGSETVGINSNSGLNLSITEWKWIRLEIDLDASSATCTHYLPRDGTTGTARSATFAQCGGWSYDRDAEKLIWLSFDRAGTTDMQVAGFWIGAGTDDWPT